MHRLFVGLDLPSTCLAMRSVIGLHRVDHFIGGKNPGRVLRRCPRSRRISLTASPDECVTVIDKYGQVTKGVWWMPWHQEAMKDVVACDKLREAGKQALIRRFLNGETHPQGYLQLNS